MADTIRKSIRRVEGSDRQVTLRVDRSVVANLEAAEQKLAKGDAITESDGTLAIAIPIQLKVWGGEIVIEGPHGTAANAEIHLDHNLVDALVRADEWRNLMVSGGAKSFPGNCSSDRLH